MKQIVWLFLLFAVVLTAGEYDAVVKVFAVSSQPNYYIPWQNFGQRAATASGFVIAGNRIVTNAHAVSYPAFIAVRKVGDQNRYPARVVAVNHECDLAILTVDAPRFFEGIKPLELTELPALQSSVAVAGYPVGGDNISVTNGVLSRIEPLQYSHSGKTLLAAQVDAAINPGNSGGPALHGGKVVGVAFQGAPSAQNIGYIIPCAILRHFMKDLEDGRLDGFPDVPFRHETLENPDLRRSLQMTEEQSGVLVTEVPELLRPQAPLAEGDVLLTVGGEKVANDGTVNRGDGQILFFGSLFWELQIGDKLPVELLRGGEIRKFELVMTKFPYRVPNLVFDRVPSYYMAGGVVFTPLTVNYLGIWDKVERAPRELTIHLGRPRESNDDEIVVISMVLADEINLGYQNFGAMIVTKADGVPIHSLRQLADLIDAKKEGYLAIELENRLRLVMDAARMHAATPVILQRYRIPADRSRDLIK